MRRQSFSFLPISIITAGQISFVSSIAWTSDSLGKFFLSQRFSSQGQNASKANEIEIKNVVLSDLLSVAGPSVNPKISQIIIVDNYAITDWQLGESGGTALLIKKEGSWHLITPGG